MADRLTPEKRSWNMSRIRSKDTAPERLVRSSLHRMGYRFSLRRRDLPGRPDIVLSKYRIAIFVHGCFWHRHAGCKYAYMPKSRVGFWRRKFADNTRRDEEVAREYRRLGWRRFVIWECEAQKPAWVRRLAKVTGRSLAGERRHSISPVQRLQTSVPGRGSF